MCNFRIFCYNRPKENNDVRITEDEPVPILAPPPKSPQSLIYSDASPRFNPFDKSGGFVKEAVVPTKIYQTETVRTDSQVRCNEYYWFQH